jgi:hypothetical protein
LNHSFSIQDAVDFGMEEAVFIANFQFWLAKNRAESRHNYDGRTWTYNSNKAFTLLFPYLTKDKVRYTLDSLVKKGVIQKGNYNKNPSDPTLWFSFVDEERFLGDYATEEKVMPQRRVTTVKKSRDDYGKIPTPDYGEIPTGCGEIPRGCGNFPNTLIRTDTVADAVTDKHGAGAPACPTEPAASELAEAQPGATQAALEATPSGSGADVPRVKNKSVDYLMAKGVEYQVALDWMVARKTKAVTPTVWSLIEEEARIAGITPVAAVMWACKRGYAQFVGAWYLEQNPKPQVAGAPAKVGGFSKYPVKPNLMDANRAAAAAYLAERDAEMAAQPARDMGEIERVNPAQEDFFNY